MDSNFYDIGPGWAAFVATFLLTVAVILLFRSLNKHLRKVRLKAASAADARATGATTNGAAQRGSVLSVEDGDRRGDVVAGETGDGE